MRTKLLIALILISVTLFSSAAFAQPQTTRPDNPQTDAAPAQGTRMSNSEAAAEAPSPDYLMSEIENLKAENSVVRELLRKMEEQQRALLEQVGRLQQQLGGATTAALRPAGGPPAADVPEPLAADANAPAPAAEIGGASVQQALVDNPAKEDRYRDGILIWENPESAKVPFMLRFNNNTQVRYLNTLDSKETFTDHLGVVREVHNRNDITVNRSMFLFGG